MELLRKYWLPLTVALVISVLILVCVIAGIKGSGRDLPTWKGLDTSDISGDYAGTGSAGLTSGGETTENRTEAASP